MKVERGPARSIASATTTAILDRILECGRLIHLDGPSGRTRHLNLEEVLPAAAERARISGTPPFGSKLAVQGRYNQSLFHRVLSRSLQGIAVRPLPCNLLRDPIDQRPFTAQTRVQIPPGTPNQYLTGELSTLRLANGLEILGSVNLCD